MKHKSFREWWASLPLWQKVFRLTCVILGILILVPLALSGFLAYINHNSLSDYDELYFCYPILPYAVTIVIVIALIYVGYQVANGKPINEHDW